MIFEWWAFAAVSLFWIICISFNVSRAAKALEKIAENTKK